MITTGMQSLPEGHSANTSTGTKPRPRRRSARPLNYFKLEPWWQRLRDDAEYRQLLERIRLADARAK